MSSGELLNPICGDCGYSLVGLPADGNCPECGANYRSDVIVVAGWGTGKRESVANASPDRIPKVALIGGGAVLVYALLEKRRRRIGVPLVFACVAAIQVWRRWRLTSDFGMTCHARLSADGFGQRDGFGSVNLISWFNLDDLEISRASNKRHRLRIASRTPRNDEVSIEFDCTESQAVYLGEAITRFRRQADIARLS